MFLSLLNIHIVADIGNHKFEVGYLSEENVGNQIEMYLNSQSSRYSPTVVLYESGQFFVGEQVELQTKEDDALFFKNFFLQNKETSLEEILEEGGEFYGNITEYNPALLFSAVINYILQNYVERAGLNETVYISLLHQSDLTLEEISQYRQIIESYPECELYMTIPISNSVVAAHLMNRKKEVFSSNASELYVVIDIGSEETEMTLVKVDPSPYTLNVQNSVVMSKLMNVGGDHISECIFEQVKPLLFGSSRHITSLQHEQLWRAINRAKHILSTMDKTLLTLEDTEHPGNDLEINISQSLIESCIDLSWNTSFFNGFAKIKEYILMNANLRTHYIYYGGSTRIPALERRFERFFSSSILKTVNLDEGAVVGGAMIVRGTLDGHRGSNRFSSFDYTRPYLILHQKRLFRLNPSMNFSYEMIMKHFDDVKISLHENEQEFIFINQTNIWEDDETTGGRKKRVEYSVERENASWYSLGSNPQNALELKFQTEDGLLNMTCRAEFIVKEIEDILQSLDLKTIEYQGLSGYNIRRRAVIKREIKKVSDYSQRLYKALSSHEANFLQRMKNDAMLEFNFTTDAAGIPSLSWIGMFITKKSNYEEFRLNVDQGKNPKESAYFDYFPLDFECVSEFSKDFFLSDDKIEEYKRTIIESNKLTHLESQYMRLINFIDNMTIVRTYSELSEGYSKEYAKLQDLLERSKEGNCSSHFCQSDYVEEGISILFNIIEGEDETEQDESLLEDVERFIEENNIFLKPAERYSREKEIQQLEELTPENYRSFEW